MSLLTRYTLVLRPIIVLLLFCLSTSWLYYLTVLFTYFFEIDEIEHQALNFPSNLDDLKTLSILLKKYFQKHPYFVLLIYASAYLYKQAFAIPGSVFLNLLGGSLFGPFYGLLICCTLCTTGSLICYFLSKFCGEIIIERFFKKKLSELKQITSQQDSYSLFTFCLCSRLFPASPNWLLNILSPIVGIPWHIFAITVCIGLAPYIYICLQTSQILLELTSVQQIITLNLFVKLSLIALVAFLPSYLVKKYSKKFLKTKND